MARIASILLLLTAFACQFKAKEEAGALVAGHQQVTEKFIVTNPSNSTYTTGEVLSFTLKHTYSVTVTGTPRITIDIGGDKVYAIKDTKKVENFVGEEVTITGSITNGVLEITKLVKK
jgi:hypothetical protein